MIRARIEIEIDGAEALAKAYPESLKEGLVRHLEGETIIMSRARENHHVVIGAVSNVLLNEEEALLTGAESPASYETVLDAFLGRARDMLNKLAIERDALDANRIDTDTSGVEEDF